MRRASHTLLSGPGVFLPLRVPEPTCRSDFTGLNSLTLAFLVAQAVPGGLGLCRWGFLPLFLVK